MMRLESKPFPKYLPEKNFLENCLEASSPQSQTLLALSARSQKQKRLNFLSESELKAKLEVRKLSRSTERSEVELQTILAKAS